MRWCSQGFLPNIWPLIGSLSLEEVKLAIRKTTKSLFGFKVFNLRVDSSCTGLLRDNQSKIGRCCWCRRYKLPVVVIVMNNGGIYGGDRRQQELKGAARKGAEAAGFLNDPIPTAFVEDSRCRKPHMHEIEYICISSTYRYIKSKKDILNGRSESVLL